MKTRRGKLAAHNAKLRKNTSIFPTNKMSFLLTLFFGQINSYSSIYSPILKVFSTSYNAMPFFIIFSQIYFGFLLPYVLSTHS